MPKDVRWSFVDTRKLGDISPMLDGLFHIVPRGEGGHYLDISCWCEPRVIWSPEAGTAIVSHWRVEPAEVTHGTL